MCLIVCRVIASSLVRMRTLLSHSSFSGTLIRSAQAFRNTTILPPDCDLTTRAGAYLLKGKHYRDIQHRICAEVMDEERQKCRTFMLR